jgi:hypothetical protein
MADNNDIEFEEFDAKNRDEVLGIYHILLALMIVLTSHGFMLGNNGTNGDFALNYCNDEDRIPDSNPAISYSSTYYPEELLAPDSFFACEIGFIEGVVDLGWEVTVPEYNERIADIMILNHESYKQFVGGQDYGFLDSPQLIHLANYNINTGDGSTRPVITFAEYYDDIILYPDTYFFVVTKGFNDNNGMNEDYYERDLFESNTNCNFGNYDFRLGSIEEACQESSFYYFVDLDYNDNQSIVIGPS